MRSLTIKLIAFWNQLGLILLIKFWYVSNLNIILSLESGVGKEFLLCPLLTTISHLMGSSFISALRTLEEGCVIYCALIASASTGKSSALNLVKKALTCIENFLETPDSESKFLNGTFIFFSINFLIPIIIC